MKDVKGYFARIVCAVLILGWGPVALSQGAYVDPDTLYAGDMSFWVGPYGTDSPQGHPQRHISVNGVETAGSFWIAKQGGGVFDVTRFTMTVLSEWEGLYFVTAYRKGVMVFENLYQMPGYQYGQSIPGQVLSFDVNVQAIDLFVIRSAFGGDGYHSRLNYAEGLNRDFMGSGQNAGWYYAGRNIAFNLPNTGKIGPVSLMTPVMDSGFIGTLEVAVPVAAAAEGDYTATFVLKDDEGQIIKHFNESAYLLEGANTITVEASAEEMQQHDGPYTVASVVVSGPGDLQIQSVVPNATPFSRWQFHPGPVPEDLNADGMVDQADRTLLMSQRNQVPYSPRDRRDLNQDGKIDLKDVLLMQSVMH